MEPAHLLRDCPECRGVRTVILDVCYVCFAEFGEMRDLRLVEGESVGEVTWPSS